MVEKESSTKVRCASDEKAAEAAFVQMKKNKVGMVPVIAQAGLAGTAPGYQERVHAFVTDWQLAVVRSITVKSGQNARRRIVTLGTSVLDVNLRAQVQATGIDALRVEMSTGCVTLRCIGKAPLWGEKGHSEVNLIAFATVPGAQLVPGGGLTHSTKQLAEYHRDRRLGIVIHAIDTSHSNFQVAAELVELGVEYAPLNLAPATVNLVLCDAQIPPQRMVLRSPPVSSATLEGRCSTLDCLLDAETLSLLINSPKSIDVAAYAVTRAKRQGVRIYTVLTPSLPLPFRIERLLSPDEACVCNLVEFAETVASLGIFCPVEEKRSNVAAVAQAISQILRLKVGADICVTLGELGCVAADAITGDVGHICLTYGAREQVRSHLKPERINGSGDRMFAVFAAQHARPQGTLIHNSRTLSAAYRACLEVLRTYSPQLHPKRNWFDVRIFSDLNH
ncbi:MAG TPA: hypothetical protein VK846_13245 [Candidatus Limnocylindria bacterium]|nr:hypothetical protein [Candidatus Limnocylindria bacterium]